MNKLFFYSFIFGILLIFLSMFFLISYYQTQKQECLKNPLIFGAKEIEDSTGKEFNGIGYITSKQTTLAWVFFNSTDYKVSTPK